MASELIIQLQNNDGTFTCEKFINLPSPKSVYIAICYTSNNESEQLAIELKNQILSSIQNLGSNLTNVQPPCNNNSTTFNSCKAIGVTDNIKLLIVVSDGKSNTFADTEILKWTGIILPVLKSGIDVTLPNEFKIPNAAFWNTKIEEVVPTIFGLIGINDEDLRIFISYKRSDTSEFAEQLFDRLNHEGFEVFLDRFSIRPAINFQNRLYQELSDKAMVIFLESSDFLTSEWIKLEIAFAKKYRLGVLAINVGTHKKIVSIDDEYRRNVTLNPIAKTLDIGELNSLITDIKMQHSIALYRMRNYLNNNIIAALESKGAKTSFDNNGFITVLNKDGTLDYKIWATARPPKVNDFHYSDICHASGIKIIFGPEFIEQKREALNTWLSQKAVVDYYNEGQIINLINLIYP